MRRKTTACIMNVEINTAADALLKAARIETSNRLCNFEVDSTSSISEIEDKVAEGQTIGYEEVDVSEATSNVSEAENDSEVETERPQVSPNQAQAHLVLNLELHIDHPHSKVNENLRNTTVSKDIGENTPGSLLELKIPSLGSLRSPKHLTSEDFEEKCPLSSKTFEDFADKTENTESLIKVETRKRKRSIMDGSGSENRSGSICKHRGTPMSPEYQSVTEDRIDLKRQSDKLHDKTLTSVEIGATDNVDINKIEEPVLQLRESPCSLERPENRKKSTFNQGKLHHTKDTGNIDRYEDTVNDIETRNNDTPTPSNDDDEAETIVKNEETEKKRIALYQLCDIEQQFLIFRDRLFEERMEQLNREELMLKQTQPSHPEYLAMLQCLDLRRNEKLRIAGKLRDFELQSLKKVAVAQRSQILVQFKQEVREVREKKIEQIGEQWYKIQHDRRNCASVSPEFSLKFPTKKSQQVINHIAYSNEVSILAGIAKHVGFPAAPVMAPATAAELEEDLEKMNRSKQITHLAASLPFHDLAALRAISANSKFKPAEEQFVEHTSWVNPHFPLHGQIVQRQVIAPQLPRTSSSLTQSYPRRHPYQHGVGPFPGIFSNPAIVQQLPGNIYPLHVPTPNPPIPSNNQN